MKTTNILYWVFKVLLLVSLIFSAIPELMKTQESIDIFKHFQYPEYLLQFMGAMKILAVLAIINPGFPRLTEWAYAGLTFDLTGAVLGGLAVGDPIVKLLPFIIFYILIFGSYIFYHKRIKAKIDAITDAVA
jgi:uncharacterized membrane protein YphA (DoxX/SURF4 family)